MPGPVRFSSWNCVSRALTRSSHGGQRPSSRRLRVYRFIGHEPGKRAVYVDDRIPLPARRTARYADRLTVPGEAYAAREWGSAGNRYVQGQKPPKRL